MAELSDAVDHVDADTTEGGDLMAERSLEKELAELLNRHSRENNSNTPDYILAQYLLGVLLSFETAVQQRETWYGRDATPTDADHFFKGEPDA